MGNPTIIWTFAGVLAAACFGRALALRTAQKHDWELLWYTFGLSILALAALLWASVEPGVIVQQRIILGLLGALAGGVGLITVGEFVRPTNASAQSNPAKSKVNETAEKHFAQNITSYNQSGGITAGTVNIGPQRLAFSQAIADELLAKLPNKNKKIDLKSIGGNADQEVASQFPVVLTTERVFN